MIRIISKQIIIKYDINSCKNTRTDKSRHKESKRKKIEFDV